MTFYSSSTSTSLAVPGAFSTNYHVRSKSVPTTYVTTSDFNWETFLKPLVRKGEEKGKEKEKNTNSVISNTSTSFGLSTGSSGMNRTHGLLTPHASIGSILVGDSERGRPTSQSQSRNSKSMLASPDNPNQSGSGKQTYSELFNANGAFDVRKHIENIVLDARASASVSVSASTSLYSYASIGVQTSLASMPSDASIQTAPPSSATRSASATPKPKRRRDEKPAYVLEGERLARELDSDFIYLAQERQQLERKIAKIKRKEKDLQSLLISGNNEDTNSDSGGTTGSNTDDPAERVRFRPLTPANSEHEIGNANASHNHGFIKSPSPARSVTSASTVMSPSKPSSSSYATFAGALNAFKTESVDGSATNTTGTDNQSTLANPGYTFSDGMSTTGSITSGEGVQRLPDDIPGLEPNVVRDPSTYLVWFDLETNDAKGPAKNIRILEVAVCLTDKNFTRLDNGISFLIHWPLSADEVEREMPPDVRKMHDKSGLLADYSTTPIEKRRSLASVERRVCKYLQKHDIQPDGRAIMAGAGVAFDRGIVRQHMEKLDAYFGHQIFDTTTLWQFVRRKYNRNKRLRESPAHRAWGDIMGSIQEAKTYSSTVFKLPRDVRWPSSRGMSSRR